MAQDRVEEGLVFKLEDIEVYFPYEMMYEEQYSYMLEMKRALDAKGHGLLEMPTGTGKTVCILSLITSYQHAHPEVGKLIFCTRTVPEMTKAVHELKRVVGFRDRVLGLSDATNTCADQAPRDQRVVQEGGAAATIATAAAAAPASSSVSESTSSGPTTGGAFTCADCAPPRAPLPTTSSTFLGLCLSSRRNMCIHPSVMARDSDREAVDSMCRDMTAPWVRRKAAGGDAGVNTCTFYEEYQERGTDAVIPSGIYSLDDLKDLGNLVSFFRGNK